MLPVTTGAGTTGTVLFFAGVGSRSESLAPCEVDGPACGVGEGVGARRGLVEPACALTVIVKTKSMLMKAKAR